MPIRRISRIAGALYVVTVLAFLVSNMVLKPSLIDATNVSATMIQLASNPFQYRIAVALDFLAMVAVMSLVFSLYVILRPINPYLALLALGWRIGEVVLQAAGKVPDYLLLTLSQSVNPSSAGAVAGSETIGQILLAAPTEALGLSFVFLAMGSLFNNFLFYRGRLIPAWLAIFGILSAALYALGSVAALLVTLPESATMVTLLPMVAFELLLGFYLAIFGITREYQAAGAGLVEP